MIVGPSLVEGYFNKSFYVDIVLFNIPDNKAILYYIFLFLACHNKVERGQIFYHI